MNTYLHSNGSLEIRKVEMTDNDLYQCIATNSAGTTTQYIRLNVNSMRHILTKRNILLMLYILFFKVPPWIIGAEKETYVEVKVSKSITLICPAIGTPNPVIRWFKNGHELEVFDVPDQYTLRDIQQTDEGIYQCVATNKAGTTYRIYNISVHSNFAIGFLSWFIYLFDYIYSD